MGGSHSTHVHNHGVDEARFKELEKRMGSYVEAMKKAVSNSENVNETRAKDMMGKLIEFQASMNTRISNLSENDQTLQQDLTRFSEGLETLKIETADVNEKQGELFDFLTQLSQESVDTIEHIDRMDRTYKNAFRLLIQEIFKMKDQMGIMVDEQVEGKLLDSFKDAMLTIDSHKADTIQQMDNFGRELIDSGSVDIEKAIKQIDEAYIGLSGDMTPDRLTQMMRHTLSMDRMTHNYISKLYQNMWKMYNDHRNDASAVVGEITSRFYQVINQAYRKQESWNRDAEHRIKLIRDRVDTDIKRYRQFNTKIEEVRTDNARMVSEFEHKKRDIEANIKQLQQDIDKIVNDGKANIRQYVGSAINDKIQELIKRFDSLVSRKMTDVVVRQKTDQLVKQIEDEVNKTVINKTPEIEDMIDQIIKEKVNKLRDRIESTVDLVVEEKIDSLIRTGEKQASSRYNKRYQSQIDRLTERLQKLEESHKQDNDNDNDELPDDNDELSDDIGVGLFDGFDNADNKIQDDKITKLEQELKQLKDDNNEMKEKLEKICNSTYMSSVTAGRTKLPQRSTYIPPSQRQEVVPERTMPTQRSFDWLYK